MTLLDLKTAFSRRSLALGTVTLAAAGFKATAALASDGNDGPDPAPAKLTLAKMTRGYADGPFGQVHYQDGGHGQPLILIHQAPMTSRQFESVYGLFMDRGIRPIGIDCPGFGMSDATTFVPKVEDYAKVVPPVLDKLGIKVADVLGHHTGAMVATEVEQQFPARVRKLILAGPFPMSEAERKEFLAASQKSEVNFVYKSDGSHMTDAFMTRYKMYAASGAAPDPKLITRYTVERFVGYGPYWYGHHAAFIYNHNETIPKIRKPTLILTATGDMIYENAKLTRKMRPDFQFAELQGGGVDIVDEQPEPWVNAAVKFLKT